MKQVSNHARHVLRLSGRAQELATKMASLNCMTLTRCEGDRYWLHRKTQPKNCGFKLIRY
jgi:hypothetical protein